MQQPATTLAVEPVTYEVAEIAPDDPAAATWREGCPVALEALRVVDVPFRGFDDRDHRGELVVHALVADAVGSVFVELFELGFPMERVELIGTFDGDDDASMTANNTSGFNCRFVAGTSTWSNHASGLAIDINPLLNPWVTRRGVFPPEAELFATRPLDVAGVINEGDRIVELFAEIGWSWGGDWSQPDYQHFEFIVGD